MSYHGIGLGLGGAPSLRFGPHVPGGFSAQTLAHITRVNAAGGTVDDPARLDRIIKYTLSEGIYANLKCLIGRGLGEELRASGGDQFVAKAFDSSTTQGDYAQATEAIQPLVVNDQWLTFTNSRRIAGNATARTALNGVNGWTIVCVAPVPPTQVNPAFLWTVSDTSGLISICGKMTTTTPSPTFRNRSWARRLGSGTYERLNHDTNDTQIVRAQMTSFVADELEHSIYASKTQQDTGATNITAGVTGTIADITWSGTGNNSAYERPSALFMAFNTRIPQAKYDGLSDLLNELYEPL